MKTQNSLRTQVLKLTALLVKQTALSFGAAQKQAWASVKLCAQMQERPVRFYYWKEDGSQREAVGFYGANTQIDTSIPRKGLAIRYYDTLVQNWRSFRPDRLIIA
ncbi:SH3 beta-barrel fold-containing protein [Spirosoma luteum]|uniref:SH3 beta-barrel fold-containing protein n=1 Tax=Spirosoma luteum TaxID=431553 RepID=UPI0003651F27|nr:SH3 beta-barrel fold-containing protein [Spirosoma luteum]